MAKKLLALAAAAAISGLGSINYIPQASADQASEAKGHPGYSYSYGRYEDDGYGHKVCEYKSRKGKSYVTYDPYDIEFKKYYKFAKLKCEFDVEHYYYPYYFKDHGFTCTYSVKKDHYEYEGETHYSLFYVDSRRKKAYLTCFFKDYDDKDFQK